MATAVLARRAQVAAALRPYLAVYLGTLAGLLLLAMLIALIPAFGHLARATLPFKWPRPHDPDPHTLATAANLWWHNSRIMLAPLALAGAVRASTSKLRTALDITLGLLLALNLLPLAVDLGTWGSQLIPYIPNAPFELLATTTSYTAWYRVTRGRDQPKTLWWALGAVLLLMGIAACLETWAVP